MSRWTTNKEAWQLLFDKYNILEEFNQNGYFKITAKQINEYRELFKDNNLAILPITSNSYMIARFQTYKKFKETEDEEIIKISFPEYIQSLDYNNITSEALAINCAYITHIGFLAIRRFRGRSERGFYLLLFSPKHFRLYFQK